MIGPEGQNYDCHTTSEITSEDLGEIVCYEKTQQIALIEMQTTHPDVSLWAQELTHILPVSLLCYMYNVIRVSMGGLMKTGKLLPYIATAIWNFYYYFLD